jgi:hypothetical protein
MSVWGRDRQGRLRLPQFREALLPASLAAAGAPELILLRPVGWPVGMAAELIALTPLLWRRVYPIVASTVALAVLTAMYGSRTCNGSTQCSDRHHDAHLVQLRALRRRSARPRGRAVDGPAALSSPSIPGNMTGLTHS